MDSGREAHLTAQLGTWFHDRGQPVVGYGG